MLKFPRSVGESEEKVRKWSAGLNVHLTIEKL